MRAYADANGLTTITPAQFYAHCEVNEWRFNGKPLNWQAYAKFCHNKTVANQKNPAKVVSAQQYMQREVDMEFIKQCQDDLIAEARRC